MSARPEKSPTTEAEATPRSSETAELSATNAARDEQIRRRAYEIHLERGGQPGCELDDWLQAENELELQRRAQEAAAKREDNPLEARAFAKRKHADQNICAPVR